MLFGKFHKNHDQFLGNFLLNVIVIIKQLKYLKKNVFNQKYYDHLSILNFPYLFGDIDTLFGACISYHDLLIEDAAQNEEIKPGVLCREVEFRPSFF